MLREIGCGNFGVAKLVRDVWTNELYAVKLIERGHKVSTSFSFCFSIEFCFKNPIFAILGLRRSPNW